MRVRKLLEEATKSRLRLETRFGDERDLLEGEEGQGKAIFWAYSRAHQEEHRALIEANGRVYGQKQSVVAHAHRRDQPEYQGDLGLVPCNERCELWDWVVEEVGPVPA